MKKERKRGGNEMVSLLIALAIANITVWIIAFSDVLRYEIFLGIITESFE